jgi:GNAT superfamily N-acetyltransferase
MDPRTDLLRRLDRYLDAVPRASADPVDAGPLRAFLSRAPWPYYARPRPELDLSGTAAVTPDDLAAAARLLADHGSAVSFEWVHELVPGLAATLQLAGYAVTLHPLLALELPAPLPPAAAVLLEPDDDRLRDALAVAEIAFAAPGTAVGAEGARERDATEVPEGQLEHIGGRLADGSAALAVAVDPRDGVVASGSHVPVDGVTEVMGVATLPTHRRRGLAVDVVARLLVDATDRGCGLALLSAADDDVARVYERLGFVRVGHAGAASLPS